MSSHDKSQWTVPKSHPRYHSLMIRERIIDGWKMGLVAHAGLIAHGRGEAFDYIIGEETRDFAFKAIRATAAAIKIARNPVISVNGNVAALIPDDIINLAEVTEAKIEVNLFYRTEERVRNIVNYLKRNSNREILGMNPDACIPGLDHARALCTRDGIYSADFVLVPLEDGDRTRALVNMGKCVATIDLNPLSRSARSATITVIDNIIRAIPKITEEYKRLDRIEAEHIIAEYNNNIVLKSAMDFMAKYLLNQGIDK